MATEGIDRLRTTAQSHHRVMIMEVMGRNAGWIALHSGIAGGGDMILIPEIPYDINVLPRRSKKEDGQGSGSASSSFQKGPKPKTGIPLSREL